MKYISIALLLSLSMSAVQAQDNKITMASLVKKEKKKKPFKALQAGDLSFAGGFATGPFWGTNFSTDAEYMLTDKLGIRANCSWSSWSSTSTSNNSSYDSRSYGLDVTYHFYQSKRLDVYAFAGLMYNHVHIITPTESYKNGGFSINTGVGVKYKIRENLGLQLEIGRRSFLGAYYKLSTTKKKSIPLTGIAFE